MSDDRHRAGSRRPRALSLPFLLVGLAAAPALGVQQAGTGRVPVSEAASRAGDAGSNVQRIVEEGVAVELRLLPAPDSPGDRVMELEDFRVSLTITDAETGEPLREMYPATWIDRRLQEGPTPTDACETKVAGYVRGTLRLRPRVDLNSYYVLSLTRGPQITVIDPLVGFGTSKLYTTILLPGPGADWALTSDGRTLFVSIPGEGQVSVVDTESWKVVRNLDAGASPTRMRLHPDGRSVWVTNEAAGAAGGVTVIDVATQAVMASIGTGAGPHNLEFAPDEGLALVTNEGEGTVTAIDAETLTRIEDIETGSGPADLAYSPRTHEVYVVHRGDGAVVAIDAQSLEVVDRRPLDAGLHAIRLIPAADGAHGHHGTRPLAGRVAFIVNRRRDVAYVLDVAGRRLLRTIEVFDGPDQIAFSPSFAYIRSAGSPEVTMVPLDDPTSGGVGVYDHFPAGAASPAEAGPVGIADAIARAPDMPDAVYVVNPEEKAIYYYHYMEGMPTPSGSLTTYGFEPTAVLLVGRNLRENRPGIYSATTKLDDPGAYDLVFLLPEPRIIHCFPFTVVENPRLRGDRIALRLRPLEDTALPLRDATVRFTLYDAYGNEPKAGIEDLRFHLAATTGWQRRVPAVPVGGGSYELSVSFPSEGVYYLSYEIPSLGIRLRDNPPLILRAVDGERNSR